MSKKCYTVWILKVTYSLQNYTQVPPIMVGYGFWRQDLSNIQLPSKLNCFNFIKECVENQTLVGCKMSGVFRFDVFISTLKVSHKSQLSRLLRVTFEFRIIQSFKSEAMEANYIEWFSPCSIYVFYILSDHGSNNTSQNW